jgi:hypothetical protein
MVLTQNRHEDQWNRTENKGTNFQLFMRASKPNKDITRRKIIGHILRYIDTNMLNYQQIKCRLSFFLKMVYFS